MKYLWCLLFSFLFINASFAQEHEAMFKSLVEKQKGVSSISFEIPNDYTNQALRTKANYAAYFEVVLAKGETFTKVRCVLNSEEPSSAKVVMRYIKSMGITEVLYKGQKYELVQFFKEKII